MLFFWTHHWNLWWFWRGYWTLQWFLGKVHVTIECFFWSSDHWHQCIFNGFGSCYHGVQWFSKVKDDDVMVSMDRHTLDSAHKTTTKNARVATVCRIKLASYYMRCKTSWAIAQIQPIGNSADKSSNLQEAFNSDKCSKYANLQSFHWSSECKTEQLSIPR